MAHRAFSAIYRARPNGRCECINRVLGLFTTVSRWFCGRADHLKARRKRQTACKPGSVPARDGEGWPFIWDARCRTPRATDPDGGAETRPARAEGLPSLLGLAPGGVCHAAAVAGGAVRSYRTISPLPPSARRRDGVGGLLSVALSLGSPPPGVTRHRVSVEPGLSSPACAKSGHPAVWRAQDKRSAA